MTIPLQGPSSWIGELTKPFAQILVQSVQTLHFMTHPKECHSLTWIEKEIEGSVRGVGSSYAWLPCFFISTLCPVASCFLDNLQCVWYSRQSSQRQTSSNISGFPTEAYAVLFFFPGTRPGGSGGCMRTGRTEAGVEHIGLLCFQGGRTQAMAGLDYTPGFLCQHENETPQKLSCSGHGSTMALDSCGPLDLPTVPWTCHVTWPLHKSRCLGTEATLGKARRGSRLRDPSPAAAMGLFQTQLAQNARRAERPEFQCSLPLLESLDKPS